MFALRFFLINTITLLVHLSVSAQGITVSPTRLFFTGAPGSVQSQTVTLSNGSKDPVSFNVTLNDWYRDSIGNKVYLEPGTREKSNASWIKTSENTVTIPGNAVKELTVTMQVPQTLKNDSVTNSMLMLTQIARQDDKYIKENSVGIKILFEFALHVFYTPAGNSNEDIEFTAIDLIKTPQPASKKIAVKLKNTGNIICDASVEFELIKKSTGEERKLEPVAISMMPGAWQIVYFDVPPDLNGDYKGVSLLRIGDASNVKVGEKNLVL